MRTAVAAILVVCTARPQEAELEVSLAADDECGEQCAVSALQRRGVQLPVEETAGLRNASNVSNATLGAEMTSGNDSMGSGGIWHYALNCWNPCGHKSGFCENYCGPGNACCRHGASHDPPECSETVWWPVLTFHTCVQIRAAATTTTTSSLDVVTPEESCTDGSQYCSTWAQQGQCKDNPGYMLKVCRQACGLCETTSTTAAGEDVNGTQSRASQAEVCEDTSSGCRYWAVLHLCGGCKKSCGHCSDSKESSQETSTQTAHFARLHRPPSEAFGYSGHAWPEMSFGGSQEMHILAIGDWGGMDGTVVVDGKRPKKDYYRIIQYKGGDTEGPHVMARSRPGCEFANLVECFNTEGAPGGDAATPCLTTCGWTEGIDDRAQLLVAEQFKRRAAASKPQYVLNVGDNFYWGGIETDCGSTPMGHLSKVAKHQFDTVFENIYNGPGLDGIPWLSVLGNHDWGGRYFNAGWDQQISYTWHSHRWILPAPYWSQHVKYPDQDFSVDILMTDSNAFDAKDPKEDPEHNICGALHTPEQASCAAQGGPASVADCKQWFWDFWRKQQRWVEDHLASSTADWKIIVTHFPCGHAASWYRKLHSQYGLNLLVTGHRHEQELWSNSALLGGLTCIVTGGGGGITSEQSPTGHLSSNTQYGFFDITISKERMGLELINQKGVTVKSSHVYRQHPLGATSANFSADEEDYEAAACPMGDC